MVDTPREIPGFYYDRAKKRYFKILPNHKAPHGSAYTKEKVKERKEDEQIMQKEDDRRVRYLSRIQRHRISAHPHMIPIGLDREIGVSTRASRLTAMGKAWSFSQKPKRSLTSWQYRDTPHHIQALHSLSNTGTFITGTMRRTFFDLSFMIQEERSDGVQWGSRQFGRLNDYHMQTNGLSTSTVLNDQHIACFYLRTPIPGLGLPRNIGLSLHACDDDVPSRYSPRTVHTLLLPIRSYNTSGRPVSTASNFSSESGYAIYSSGDSHMAIVTLAQERGVTTLWNPQPSLPLPNGFGADILGMDWLYGPVFGVGLRNGASLLCDLRSDGWVHRLQFPTAVAQLHRVDNNRLVLAGPTNQMHMYDLRFAKAISGFESPSQPYLSYPEFRNPERIDFPLAISPHTGLLATAQSASGPRFFDLWTGKRIDSDRRIFPSRVEKMVFVGQLDSNTTNTGSSPRPSHVSTALALLSGNDVYICDWN
ncbi:hypothetical protein MMC25_006173 [Agyrium rufum]|nr:hypothetical protein [Agyrium rufum]